MNVKMQPAVHGLLLAASLLCGCADRRQTAPSSGPGILFVATNGNDSWSGRLASPNRDGSDGPFATISRSLAAARALRAQSNVNPTNPVTILVRGGFYFLNEPLALRPEDSNLRLAAAAGERVVISGGRRISGWKEATVGAKKYWVSEIPEARDGKWFFHEL